MRERDRLSLKAEYQRREADELAEREERERPIREAESRIQGTLRELAKVYRARLLGEVRDPDVFVDPAVATVRMTEAQAKDFNNQSVREYRESHPEVYWCEELIELVGHYFDANALRITSAAMVDNVVTRMRDAGLVPERPEPKPQPEPTPEPEQSLPPPGPQTYVGRDWQTGLDREFTEREVNRMSSLEYQRAFKIAPTFGELFAAMRQQREQR
jgi:hypothetical protein